MTKSDEKKETACVEFLKWFTAKEQNTDFSVSAGYVPVTKDALTLENLQAAAESIDGASGRAPSLTARCRTGRWPIVRRWSKQWRREHRPKRLWLRISTTQGSTLGSPTWRPSSGKRSLNIEDAFRTEAHG